MYPYRYGFSFTSPMKVGRRAAHSNFPLTTNHTHHLNTLPAYLAGKILYIRWRALRCLHSDSGVTLHFHPRRAIHLTCVAAAPLHSGISNDNVLNQSWQQPASEVRLPSNITASTRESSSPLTETGSVAGGGAAGRPLHLAVKRDVRKQQRSGDPCDAPKAGRSFKDVMHVLAKMIGAGPNRCPDNLAITNTLLDRLDLRPAMVKMRYVHIAGTKGKGTTAAYTAALLTGYGFKVGLFTSPHLTDVRERFVIDGRLLSHDTFTRYFFEVHDRMEALAQSESLLDRDTSSRSNYFRFLFLLSLHIFAAENVEVAVMEVGIGGRTDATNTLPTTVSVITALGFEHMEIIGNTLEEITHEKAGIMREGVVCFASPQSDHPNVRGTLKAAACEKHTPLLLLDRDVFPLRSWPQLAIGGDHAIEDSKLALMAARYIAGIPPVSPLDEVERQILSQMTFAGRSQVIPIAGGRDCTIYLDGAHTVESLGHATKWFLQESAKVSGESTPRRVLVYYNSRDPSRILKTFMPYTQHFCKTVISQIANPKLSRRTLEEEGREQHAREVMVTTTECWRSLYREVPCLPCAQPFGNLQDLLDLILPAASDSEDASKPVHVFVTGSLYLVGEFIMLIEDYAKRH